MTGALAWLVFGLEAEGDGLLGVGLAGVAAFCAGASSFDFVAFLHPVLCDTINVAQQMMVMSGQRSDVRAGMLVIYPSHGMFL